MKKSIARSGSLGKRAPPFLPGRFPCTVPRSVSRAYPPFPMATGPRGHAWVSRGLGSDAPQQVAVPRAAPRRFGVLDWIRIGLLAAGLLCVLTGLLPAAEAEDNARRIAPLLLFLG